MFEPDSPFWKRLQEASVKTVVVEATMHHKKGESFNFTVGDTIKLENGEIKIVNISIRTDSIETNKSVVEIHYDWKTLDGKHGSDKRDLKSFLKTYL